MRTAGSNRLRGELRAVNFEPGKSLIRLDFIEHKSERSVMPQDTGVGRNVVLGRFGLRQLTASLGANLWGC